MIVCSCNVLSEHELRRAVAGLRAHDPCAVITPGRVLHAVGRRIRCRGCLRTLFQIIAAEDGRAAAADTAGNRWGKKNEG